MTKDNKQIFNQKYGIMDIDGMYKTLAPLCESKGYELKFGLRRLVYNNDVFLDFGQPSIGFALYKDGNITKESTTFVTFALDQDEVVTFLSEC